MAGIIKLNYDHKALAGVVISSIMIINVMPLFGAYLMNIIYDCKTFIVQATGDKNGSCFIVIE